MKLRIVLSSIVLSALTLVILANPAQAKDSSPVDYTNIPAGESIDSSVSANGNQVNIAGTVNGDLFCTGVDITISGNINGDVICAGQNINISGQVSGDVIALANNFTLSSSVNGSVTLLSSNTTISQNARITQDFRSAGSNITVDGLIGRDVTIDAMKAVVGATIGRDLKGQFGSLTLSPTADIRGNVTYKSNSDIIRENNSKVAGEVSKSSAANSSFMAPDFATLAFGFVLFFISLLIVSMSTVFLFPGLYIRASKQINEQIGRTSVYGLLNLIVVPLVLIIISLTFLGIPLAGLILAIWAVTLMLSGPVFAYFVGSRLARKSKKPAFKMLIGSIVILSLYAVPVVNIIVATIVGVVGSGAIIGIIKKSTIITKKA